MPNFLQKQVVPLNLTEHGGSSSDSGSIQLEPQIQIQQHEHQQEQPMYCQPINSTGSDCVPASNTAITNRTTTKVNDKKDNQRLQRHHIWILLIRHATKCQAPPGKCKVKRCHEMKKVCQHIKTCQTGRHCTTRHCYTSKKLLSHYMRCPNGGYGCNSRESSSSSLGESSQTSTQMSNNNCCPICDPVKSFIREAKHRDKLGAVLDDLQSMAISRS